MRQQGRDDWRETMMQHYQIEEADGRILIAENEYAPEFEAKSGALFCQANGFMGVHGATALPSLWTARGTFAAGLFHRAAGEETEELVNGPDITRITIAYGTRMLTSDGDSLVFFRRTFSPETGELSVRQQFKPEEGAVIELRERRFASYADSRFFFQELEITALEAPEGGTQEMTVAAYIDASVTNSGVSHFEKVQGRVEDHRIMKLTCSWAERLDEDVQGRTLEIRSACRWDMPEQEKEASSVFILKRRGICEQRKLQLRAGETLRVMRWTEVDAGVSDGSAVQNHTALDRMDYDAAFVRHEKAMHALFERGRIIYGGTSAKTGSAEAAALQTRAAVALARYHILGMVPWGRSDCSVAAKGLTGEGYKGHVFWDTEIFILPYLVKHYPEQAKKCLLYRYAQLPGARSKASEYGYEGALFPWESACDGREQTPRFAAINIHTGKANPVWSALKEHHISADIGYAVLRYVEETGDEDFLRSCGLEMLAEISLFWCSRAKWDEKREKYVITDVIGPDEYTEHIDNNAYTNYMAHYVMSRTIELLEGKYRGVVCGAEEERPDGTPDKAQGGLADQAYDWRISWRENEARIRKVRDGLYLPQPDENGIIPQDDTFAGKTILPDIARYRDAPVRQLILQDYTRDQVVDMQVLKQADTVMLLTLLPHLFDPETVRKNIRYYAERTVHDSSLSYCMHSLAFAMAGDRGMAQAFFEKSLDIDFNDNPLESTDGIHAAAMGGILMCVECLAEHMS